MEQKKQVLKITVDKYTRVCLTVIAALLTVLILGLWSNHVPLAVPAMGANGQGASEEAPKTGEPKLFGESSAIRVDILGAMQENNAKLDELMKLLKSGEVKVQVATTEGKASGGSDAPANNHK